MTAETTAPRRILVIVNETVEGSVLHRMIRVRENSAAKVMVVAPALNSRLRHWVSDEDEARRGAELRLAACVEQLARAGIQASGLVGDADPLQAIDDALHQFAADEVVVATHPERRSNWLARDLVTRARRRLTQPVVHVVVDSAQACEYIAGAGGSRISLAEFAALVRAA